MPCVLKGQQGDQCGWSSMSRAREREGGIKEVMGAR